MVRLLPWILDAIVLFLVIRMILQLLGRGRVISRGRSRAEPPGRTTERVGGTLVRDPHCGTYVPESRALQVRSGGETLHFCSPACRDAYERRP